MRVLRFFTVVWVILALSPGLPSQNFSIDWATIENGGGTSTGTVFSVTGTIGQADAGIVAGGPYSLVGGFWSAFEVVQTPSEPFLSARAVTPTQIVLSWPADGGFELQQTSDLGLPSWSTVPEAPARIGGENSLTVTIGEGNRFYRLVKR